MKLRFRQFGIAALFLAGIGLLTGCGKEITLENDMQNVEQRDYATIMMVASGEQEGKYKISLGIAQEKKVGEKSQAEELTTFSVNDIEDLEKKYQSVKGNSLSLVHLKAILLVREKGSFFEAQGDILNILDEDMEIAKTCPVLQLAEGESFEKYVKDSEEPVGKYISNLIKLQEGQGADIPWLKDYMKVLREGTKLSVYFLEKEKEGWKLKCQAFIE